MRRVFTLTFMITLILFFTVFGLCESYIAIQNTTSKDKITSVMEGFVDKEKGEIEIHFFGKELLKFPISEISVPYEFSAFVPPYMRVLWITLKEISPTDVGDIFLFFGFLFFCFSGFFFNLFFCLLFFFRSLFSVVVLNLIRNCNI